ncbi:MAG: hypothetical protein A2583_15495 [Bdellovibrionales bacterium RIFOXYD1_FULL_53_11]|nr:MAG: hypothetical protein A2583_15495 [Bdellovibrionales bacterium RIFOXYD1_FULL_53_11]
MKTNKDRTQRLLDEMRRHQPEICIERAYLLTKFHKELSQDVGEELHRASGLKYVLDNKQVKIHADELIVGNYTSKRLGAPFYPELTGIAMISDYYNPFIKKRPLRFSRGDKKLVYDYISKYWLNKNIIFRAFFDEKMPSGMKPGRLFAGLPGKIVRLLKFIRYELFPVEGFVNEVGGIIHLIPDFEGLIHRGPKKIIEGIEAASAKAVTEKEIKFLESLKIAAEGLTGLAQRYSREAQSEAKKHPEGSERSLELLEIARICMKISQGPAETVQEALQAIMLAHIALVSETLDMSISFGRMDQYLYPIYLKEVEKTAREKGLSAEAAAGIVSSRTQELLQLFFLKTNEIYPIFNAKTSEIHEGLPNYYAVTIGGLTPEGKDGENEVTRIFFKVIRRIHLRQPNYALRTSSLSRKGFLEEALDLIRTTGFTPSLFNDDAIVPALAGWLPKIGNVTAEQALKDARNYGTIGCVELGIPGKAYPMADAGGINVTNCISRIFRKKEYNGIKSYQEIKDALVREINLALEELIESIHKIESARRDYFSLPMASMLVQGCLEKKLDITAGGAIYNSSAIQMVGTADVIDSLMALDVALAGGYSYSQLSSALKKNYRGSKKLMSLLRGAPKYGNNHEKEAEYIDFLTGTYVSGLKSKSRPLRGGYYVAGGFSGGAHALVGGVMGALPSGRPAGHRLANGVSPADWSDACDLLSSMSSVSKINPSHFLNCYTYNQALDPLMLETAEKTQAVANALRVFFGQNRKGMQIQFNVLDQCMLIEARNNPDSHPWLVVRVAGYSAYFRDLSKKLKNEIIDRTKKCRL